jgi:hypothetical protein
MEKKLGVWRRGRRRWLRRRAGVRAALSDGHKF